MNRFEGIDWERLGKRLYVAARFATPRASDMFDGISAEDLASETLAAFFASPNMLGWKSSKGPLDKFLVGVLQNKAKMHLRRERRNAGSIDDPDAGLNEPLQQATVGAEAEFRSLQERLFELIGDDGELRDLIAAVELTTGAHNVNQELAQILNRTPQQIVNLKRRLLNVPGVREAMYEEQ